MLSGEHDDTDGQAFADPDLTARLLLTIARLFTFVVATCGLGTFLVSCATMNACPQLFYVTAIWLLFAVGSILFAALCVDVDLKPSAAAVLGALCILNVLLGLTTTLVLVLSYESSRCEQTRLNLIPWLTAFSGFVFLISCSGAWVHSLTT